MWCAGDDARSVPGPAVGNCGRCLSALDTPVPAGLQLLRQYGRPLRVAASASSLYSDAGRLQCVGGGAFPAVVVTAAFAPCALGRSRASSHDIATSSAARASELAGLEVRVCFKVGHTPGALARGFASADGHGAGADWAGAEAGVVPVAHASRSRSVARSARSATAGGASAVVGGWSGACSGGGGPCGGTGRNCRGPAGGGHGGGQGHRCGAPAMTGAARLCA